MCQQSWASIGSHSCMLQVLRWLLLRTTQMSYNNYLDGDAAYSAVSDIPGPACVVVKHTNPCGAATRDDLLDAYRLAVRADPISAFGGIVAFNRWEAICGTQTPCRDTDKSSRATVAVTSHGAVKAQ